MATAQSSDASENAVDTTVGSDGSSGMTRYSAHGPWRTITTSPQRAYSRHDVNVKRGRLVRSNDGAPHVVQWAKPRPCNASYGGLGRLNGSGGYNWLHQIEGRKSRIHTILLIERCRTKTIVGKAEWGNFGMDDKLKVGS